MCVVSISSLHNDHTVRELQCLLTANLWQTDSEGNEEKYCEIKHQTRLAKLHQMADLASDFSGRLFGDTLCSPYTLDLTVILTCASRTSIINMAGYSL